MAKKKFSDYHLNLGNESNEVTIDVKDKMVTITMLSNNFPDEVVLISPVTKWIGEIAELRKTKEDIDVLCYHSSRGDKLELRRHGRRQEYAYFEYTSQGNGLECNNVDTERLGSWFAQMLGIDD